MKDLGYRFLSNTPVGEDLFAGKSQENIAVIITKVLQEDNFHILGIDGGWGTGKSNLVKIVEKKLANNCNFFIYDVWGHQEDDQRKSILIELTEYIADSTKGLAIEHNKWSEKLGRLLSKETTTTTTSIPFLSIGFILSLILIIYVPTVNTFAKDIKDYRLKIIIVLAPIAIWMILYCIKAYNNFKNIRKKSFLSRISASLKISLQQMMQIYGNKQTDETKFETISEKEPSVKDFRDWMRDIDKDLETNSKKLVIVFDNFDRLSKKHIQSIWSSIHIFFADEKYKNIKVIIPFDRMHIKSAFSELNGNNTSVINFANDYINKTFDLVYRVSPPIMSNWKKFFNTCWKEAFQIHFDINEYLKIEQVFEAYANPITPREIIAFINEVISIKILHPKIPERFIGVFVLNKEGILEDPLKAITQGEFLGPLKYLYKDNDNFQRYITSLSYQIDPDQALEIVYRKQLRDSLAKSNIEVLNEIAQTEVFPQILANVIGDFESLENPIVLLDKLTSDAQISQEELTKIWDDIYMIKRATPFLDFDLKESHKVLFQKISPNYKTELAKDHLMFLASNSNFNANKYAEIIDEYEKFNTTGNFGIGIFNLITLNTTSAEDFISLVKNKKSLIHKYKISTSERELNEYLAKTEAEKFADLTFVQYLTRNYNLDTFKKVIPGKIKENSSNIETLSSMYQILKYLTKDKTRIDFILTDDEIHDLYSQTEKGDDFDYDLLAMRIARGDQFSASYQASFESDLSDDGMELVQKIAERIEYFINYGEFCKSSVSFSHPLIAAVIRHLAEKSYQTSRANIKELISQFEEICEANELNPQLFMNRLDNWKLPEFSNPFIQSIPKLFFKTSLENDSDLANNSLLAVRKYFDELDENQWEIIFSDTEGKDFSLLQIINYKEWNSIAFEAFKKVLNNICLNGLSYTNGKFEYLMDSFTTCGKDFSNTFKNLRDEFVNGRAIMTKELYLFLGDNLFKYAELEEKADDVFRRILISALLFDEGCLKILMTHKENIKQLLKISKPKTHLEFKDRIKELFLKKPSIQELGLYLNIKPPKSNEEQEKKMKN